MDLIQQINTEELKSNRKTLYIILNTIDYIEKMFINSTLTLEEYIKECTTEMERFIRIFPFCQFQSISDAYSQLHLEKGFGYQRVVNGKPTLIEHKIIKSGKLIIEITSNILTLINFEYMKIYDIQEYIRLLNLINIQLSVFESTNQQFEKYKEELKEWELKLLSFAHSHSNSEFVEQSSELINLLNITLNLFKEINN